MNSMMLGCLPFPCDNTKTDFSSAARAGEVKNIATAVNNPKASLKSSFTP